ncbi:MAG TPA: DUF2127 domain-containing protein [Rhodanobacter sp.]|nr:DUF2127 domain-containing protein [Rhodanobacter sp.]
MKPDWSAIYHRAFDIGILLKGLDGLLESTGGLALLLTSQPAIRGAVAWLTHQELIEDPGDVVANHLVHLAQRLSMDTQHFAGVYLLAHGVIKMGLVAALLRGLRWSYPAAVAVLTAFIGYQGYRLMHTPSLALGLLTALDVAVVMLIVREWRRHVLSDRL